MAKRTLYYSLSPSLILITDISDEYAEAICRDLNVEELTLFIPKPTFWGINGVVASFLRYCRIMVIGVVSYLKDFIFNLLGLSKKKEEEE